MEIKKTKIIDLNTTANYFFFFLGLGFILQYHINEIIFLLLCNLA